MRILPLLALSLAASAGSAAAMTVDALVFGDSLSDPFVAEAPTPGKQLTNGDTWAVQIGAESPAAGNFAQSGAVALSDDDPATDQDFAGQVSAFARSDLTLAQGGTAYVWFGGNDAADAARSAAPVALLGGSDGRIADAIADRIGPAVVDLGDGLTDLAASGVENVVVFTAPDIGLTPLARTLGIEQLGSAASSAFNAGLRGAVGGLPNDANVSLLDTAAVVAPVLADPAAFGISDLDTPCIADPFALFECEGYAFFDPFHPTEQLHALFADAARAAAGGNGTGVIVGGGAAGPGESPAPSAVPLPASAPLLVAGIGFLAVWRRRRAPAAS